MDDVRPADSVRLVSHPEPRHHCDLPGFIRRRKLGVVTGSVVECLVCGQRWCWGGDMYGSFWERHIDGSEGA